MDNQSFPESDVQDVSDPSAKTAGEWFILAMMIVISAMAVISNVLMVIMLLRQRWQKSHGDFWKQVVHLACINIAVGFIVMPTSLTYSINGIWQLPQIICRLFITCDAMLNSVNTLTMLSINIDRLLFTYRPSYHVRNTKTWQTVLKIILPWVVALATILPAIEVMHISSTFHYTEAVNQCFIMFGDTGTLIFNAFAYFIPAFLILVSSIAQVSIVMMTARENHVIRLAVVMCVLNIAYLLMTLPFFSVLTIVQFQQNSIPSYVLTASLWVSYGFSGVMPIIWLFYEDYRLGCWRTVRCRTRKQRPHSYLDNSMQLKMQY